ncbi:potassium channel family protein [Microbacterium sp. X-17]|uniref:potassium channel family protein n=1 Tax=Microbacterium sp. X-17 TaxID=3144404 RepID=UPI0031F599DD
MTGRGMTIERWQDIAYWPLLIASLAFVVAYSWQVIADLPYPHRGWTVAVLLVTWLIFVVDYLARFWLAPARGHWFRTHLFDLLIVLLPPLRPLRLLRTLGVARHRRQTKGDELRSRIAVYGALSAAIIIWFAALAELEAERHAPGATIVSMGDAIWWAFVTITTVGYGDYTPVTIAGRVIAVGLMAGGVAIVGVTAASISSWIIERAAGGRDDNEAATRGQIRALARQIDAFGERMGMPPADDPTPPADDIPDGGDPRR